MTPERMLRELADALESLAARDALILVLEDLHWSDTATLEWLAYIARRRDPARLMIVGTYRPFEVLLHKHPLRNLTSELRPYPQCSELVLDYLSSDAVQTYVLQRCGRIPRLTEIAAVLHRRTGGHPLFLATIVDELMRRRILEGPNARGVVSTDPQAVAGVIPASVRQFIEHRFEQLSTEEQALLEASSVAGDPFSVAAVAAATSLTAERIEARCEAWTRAGPVSDRQRHPDVAGRDAGRPLWLSPRSIPRGRIRAYFSGAARSSTPPYRQPSGKRLRKRIGDDRRRVGHALRAGTGSRKSCVVP